jgi:uncharacterized protein (DUF1778 family)
MPIQRDHADPRTARIILRVRPSERAHLESVAAAHETTVSDLVRRACLGLAPPTLPPSRVERDAVVALNKLGANLWRAMQAADDLRPHIQPLLEDIAAMKQVLCT